MIYGGNNSCKHIFEIQKLVNNPVAVNICYIDYTHNAWNKYSRRSTSPSQKLLGALLIEERKLLFQPLHH